MKALIHSNTNKHIAIYLLIITLSILSVTYIWLYLSDGLIQVIYERWTSTQSVQQTITDIFSSPVTYSSIALILLLEYLFPAKQAQPIFSVGLAQDFIYYLIKIINQATLVIIWGSLFLLAHKVIFSSWNITIFDQTSSTMKALIALLWIDFTRWFVHYLKHKVKWFWPFHAVHHSQRQMNIFTNHRLHILEPFITKLVIAVPLLIVDLSLPSIIYLGLAMKWHTWLVHANIKSDFWILRYVIVTPQSHRIHHSSKPEHRDKNFGVNFSIWDIIFGTQYYGWNEYPDTGIEDSDFPHEKTYKDIFTAPIKQLIYPFKAFG